MNINDPSNISIISVGNINVIENYSRLPQQQEAAKKSNMLIDLVNI